MLVTLVIIGILGILIFKSYFTASSRSVAEAEKVYETVAPQASAQTKNDAPEVNQPQVNANIERAKELEGNVFMAAIINAEKMHYVESGNYAYTGWT
ncbi:MAG: hypothetical protein FWC57_02735, partial [Endomicrobia bacterium]|nr:hypothetical protein [Endomicrobiia bacterium]